MVGAPSPPVSMAPAPPPQCLRPCIQLYGPPVYTAVCLRCVYGPPSVYSSVYSPCPPPVSTALYID